MSKEICVYLTELANMAMDEKRNEYNKRFFDDDDTPIVPIGHEDVEEEATAEDAAPMLTIFDLATRDELIQNYFGEDNGLTDVQIDELLDEGRRQLEAMPDDNKIKSLFQLALLRGDYAGARSVLPVVTDPDVSRSMVQTLADIGELE